MSEIDDLYQEVILDHNRSPRNFREIENANRKSEGYNPLCGDHVTIYVDLAGGIIRDISFKGSGCAISKASASMMTTELKGKSQLEAESVFENMHRMLTGGADVEGGDFASLGKLRILSGVCKFPARVKCASLAWHTVNAALKGVDEVASTQ
jgi:nitrogen fixation NifU-like protein